MASQKKHILLTGGSGFVGSHLSDRFLAAGYAVTAIDNFVSGRKSNVAHLAANDDFRLVEADVSEPWPESKLELVTRLGVYGVLHFACPASPIDFATIPMEIMRVDSIGTFHAVEWAQRFGARLVIASTSEVYGDPEVHPQQEDYWGNVNPIGPRACYDEAKRFSEALVSTATRLKGLNGGIVRIFNTYGPRMRLDDGRLVPELCRQMLQEVPLTLHGDGQQTRSFCYVEDLVEGIFRYFESDLKEPVNLGNPKEFTIREFADELDVFAGKKLERAYTEGRPDDPKRRKPDITRAQTLLGWTPKVELAEGLAHTLASFRQELR